MRQKTKEELTKLAEILVSKYQVKEIKGTSEFLESALVEARRNKIEVDRQSIRKYEQWLEMKCASLQGQVDYMASQSKEDEHEDFDDNWYDCYGDVVDDMAIVRRAAEIMNQFAKDKSSNEFFNDLGKVKIPDYTFFAEGEDGLIYIKGKFAGHLVTGKGIAHNGPYTVTEAKYADYILRENREGRGNITEDDALIFIKIALGQI